MDTHDYEALAQLARAADEARRQKLAEIFGEGAERAHLITEMALVLAELKFSHAPHTQADVKAEAAWRMANDPAFHASVHTIVGVASDYMDAAARFVERAHLNPEQTESTPADDSAEVWAAFHKVWSFAVGRKAYDKQRFIEFEAYLLELRSETHSTAVFPR